MVVRQQIHNDSIAGVCSDVIADCGSARPRPRLNARQLFYPILCQLSSGSPLLSLPAANVNTILIHIHDDILEMSSSNASERIHSIRVMSI